MKEEIRDFRVHHILCTNLYRGLGYDGDFCINMTKVVSTLKENPNQKLRLLSEPDWICGNCPNLTEKKTCRDDSNHVKIKDQKLFAPLRLKEGGIYTFQELREHAKKYLSQEAFEESCKNCKWYLEGICKYEDFDFSNEK